MKIDSTKFGSITIEGKKYKHDVMIFVNGEIKKREKSGHEIGIEEIEPLIDEKPEYLVIGIGQWGWAHSPTKEALKICSDNGIEVIQSKTKESIKKFNQLKGKKSALIHVFC